jgi:hypothetical protein
MTKRARYGLVIFIAALALALTCPRVFAEEGFVHGASQKADRWQFFVAPYFWMAGLDGKTTVKGVESSTNLSFSDIWENLDVGAQAHVEAWRGKWGMFLDAIYLKLSNDGSGVSPTYGPVDIDVQLKEWIVEGGGFYRLLAHPVDRERMVSLDVLGGLRYISLYGKLSASVPLVGIDSSPSGTKNWVDPFLGLRLMADLTKNLAITVRGDIGGFGVGSHFAYNASAIFGYTISPLVSVWFGYRIMGINYEDGYGPDKFKYDVTMHGPVVGIGFRF